MLLNKYVKIAIIVFIVIIAYGFYEKERRANLYKDFRANKPLQCGDIIVQKSKGWRIGGNRVFTNGKTAKTVIFCKSID